MPLFSASGTSLKQIHEQTFSLEKDIQKLTEENLKTVFGYEFVSTEFQLNNLRIDTLAFDHENKSFVIIEYKKDRNLSVIDQGYTYLALLLNNKADFILEYNERTGQTIKRDDVDWSQSKVVFISPEFTTYQKGAIEFRDLPIELWEVKRYENDMVLYAELKAPQVNESISTISRDKTITAVSKEIREYSLEDHLQKGSENTRSLFEQLHKKILELDEAMRVEFKKTYIAYKLDTNVVDIVITPSKLWVFLNIRSGKLTDPYGIARDLTQPKKIGHLGNGDYDIRLGDAGDIDKCFELITQAYANQKHGE
ncbi:MAG: DUF5655 domain-containing protein [Patescibacteria group bacterium]